MLVVLALIDVVMISNLLIMVIVGGYETFVSRARRSPRPTRMAIVSQRIRAQGEARDGDHRHLVDPPAEDVHQRGLYTEKVLLWQTVIHLAFLLSAIAIAMCDRILPHADAASERH